MKFFEKIKSMKVKAPWYSQYKNIKKNIKCPNISAYAMVKKVADKYPKYIAYSYFNATSTYAKFIKDIDLVAKSFDAMGIKSGDAVTICMPNTPEAIVSFYALNKIGAIANMIHPLSSEAEIINYCDLSDSKMIIAIDMVYDKVQSAVGRSEVTDIVLVSVDRSMGVVAKLGYWLIKKPKIQKVLMDQNTMPWSEFVLKGKNNTRNIKDLGKSKTPALILYSGGTSGKPKGILHSNGNLNSSVLQQLEVCKSLYLGVSILSVMPIFHGFGLASCIHASFVVGGKCIFLPQFNAKKFDGLLRKYRPNIIAGVPTLFEALINNKNMAKSNLSYLKCLICGGDNLSPSAKEKIDKFLKEHHSPAEIRPAYGLTECVAGVCMSPINNARPGSIGIPCPGTYIKIVEPNTHDQVPYNQDGEICISGPSVMMGYIKEPKETALVLRKHEDGLTWLHTGDLGCMDEEGFVYFKQRIKRMIISSGYNIYPQHIENVICEIPEVLTCIVIGIDDEYRGQIAKAFIVLKDGVEPDISIKKKVRDHCQQNIAKYMMPREYEFRKTLPTTKVGKVAYNMLIEEEKQKKEIEN